MFINPLRNFIYSLLVFLLGFQPSHGAKLNLSHKIALYKNNGQMVDNYNEIIALKHELIGHHFVFNDGFKFFIDKYVDAGNTSHIFFGQQSSEGSNFNKWMILRLPLVRDTRQFINKTLYGADTLRSHGVPFPLIYAAKADEYIAGEFIQIAATLTDFIFRPEKFNKEDLFKMDKSLKEFLMLVAQFEQIGDFHLDQLVYHHEAGWALIDWSDRHILRKMGSKLTIFTPELEIAERQLGLGYERYAFTNNELTNGMERLATYNAILIDEKIRLDRLEIKHTRRIIFLIENYFPLDQIKKEVLNFPISASLQAKFIFLKHITKLLPTLLQLGMTMEDFTTILNAPLLDFGQAPHIQEINIKDIKIPTEVPNQIKENIIEAYKLKFHIHNCLESASFF